MSNFPPGRGYAAQLRQPSLGGSLSQQQQHQSPALVARINEKKQELEHLIALRDLSGGLATQMQQLEEKLETLADGTEAVAAVLSNWHNVLRAIAMASSKLPKPKEPAAAADEDPFAPTPAKTEVDVESQKDENELPMPQTLVRIPVQPEQQGRR